MRHAATIGLLRFKLGHCLGAALAALTAMTAVPAAAEEYFYVVNTATKMLVEVLAHRTDVGSPVVLWPHYGGTSQQFFVYWTTSPGAFPISEKDPWFLLKARHSGLCLKTKGYQSGAPIVQAECDGDASQMLRVRTIAMTPADCPSGRCFGGVRHVLQNYYDSGKRCFDAANGKFPAPPAQGAGLQAWDCIGKFSAANAVNQEWELVNIKDWNAPGPSVH